MYESRLPSIRFTLATLFTFTSILLKNSSRRFHRHRFFKSESGCKYKAFSPFPPNLSRGFFKLFFETPVERASRRERSPSTQPERRLHVNSTPACILPLSRFGGCKDKANVYHFPNFSTTFFSNFFNRHWKPDSYNRKSQARTLAGSGKIPGQAPFQDTHERL